MSNEPYSNPNAPYAPSGATQAIPVQQPGQPFASASKGERRKGLLIAGIVLLLAGIGGGIAAFLAAQSAEEEGVENLARAPVGCTTRLDFEETGTFIIYVETKGEAGDTDGDCPAAGESYERDDEDLPDVELVLVDSEGDEVDLDDEDGTTYDAGGSKGESISSVEIEEDGRYELTVTSDDDDFAIAVGKDPAEAPETLKLVSFVLMGVGLVGGLALIALGLRRKGTPSTGATTPVTYYPEQQPPAAYTPTGAHTPPAPPTRGGYAPPSGDFLPPSPPPPSSPTQQWPAPPST